MPSPYGPPRTWGPAGRRRGPAADPNLRVSDADRSEVADRLSKHYSDGRLDQAEFNERLERAMNAKTQGDLGGLLDDLPADPPSAEVVRERTRQRHPILFLFLIVVLVAMAGNLLFHPFYFFHPFFFLPVPWLLIGVVAFLLLRRRRGSWRYRGGQGPQ